MEILYFYDIKAKNKKEFNRTKRRFYSRLNQMLPKDAWRTKSTILVQMKKENIMDSFFRAFRGHIIVYKANINSIEQLE